MNFRREANAGILFWFIDSCLLTWFVCEACGIVDCWWGTARGEVAAARLFSGGCVAVVGWLVGYNTRDMTQVRNCQLSLVHD